MQGYYSSHLCSVEHIIDLRHRVLRFGLPRATAYFPDDAHPDARHFATEYVDGDTRGPAVCCLTFVPEILEGVLGWQVRGMATDEAHRRKGLARDLLAYSKNCVLAARKLPLLWCNARISAIPFYEKQGWEIVSEIFEIDGVGPHVKMCRSV